ncbi:MAG TPA: glycosyltransferase family 4 protein [Alphaproteobacteria bacterium]|nr:glycosyltransferase family 4 protein [Alphaproteobacteria bacterium]
MRSRAPTPAAAPAAAPRTADARMPAVLQVVPSLVTGGVERGAADVSAALVQAGWRSVVVSAGGPMVREIERAGATHVVLPVDSRNPLVVRRNIGRLADLITLHRIDLVHARSRASAWSAWGAAQRTGRPFVTTFHGVYNENNPVKHWYNSIMTRGARVIAISEFVGRHVAQRYGTASNRIRVIHRGVDFTVFDPHNVSQPRIVQLAREWRLPDGVPIIMLPGRLTRWKGQMVLIDALAQLGRRDVCCLLVGSDQGRAKYRKEIEQRVRLRGLEGVVRMVDHCRDMPAAYMLADVVVSASTDPEAFGRVVAEAQAMGRPVIAPSHGAAPEIVRSGETGWLVPPNDPRALASALDQALKLDAEQRDVLAHTATEHVRRHFTRDSMCAATIEVYREVLADHEVARWKSGR